MRRGQSTMMTNPALDPNDEVLAPLDRTLESLVTRGMAAFAVNSNYPFAISRAIADSFDASIG